MRWDQLFSQILASAIFLAVVPAVIAGIVSVLTVRWQQRGSQRDALGAARLVYGEIAFNLALLSETLRADTPPRYWISDDAWRAHQATLATVLEEVDLAVVFSPYQLNSAYRRFFEQTGVELIVPRLTGQDRALLGRLHKSFLDAEETLRPRVWTGVRKERLTKWLASQSALEVRRSRRSALTGLFSLRSGLAILALLIFVQALDRIARAIGRLGPPTDERAEPRAPG